MNESNITQHSPILGTSPQTGPTSFPFLLDPLKRSQQFLTKIFWNYEILEVAMENKDNLTILFQICGISFVLDVYSYTLDLHP